MGSEMCIRDRPTRNVNNKFWPLHNDKASVPDIFYIQIQPYILNFIGKVTVLPSKINCVNGKAPSSSKISLRRDRAIGQRPRIHHTHFSCPNVSPFSQGIDDGVQTGVTTLHKLLEDLNGLFQQTCNPNQRFSR